MGVLSLNNRRKSKLKRECWQLAKSERETACSCLNKLRASMCGRHSDNGAYNRAANAASSKLIPLPYNSSTYTKQLRQRSMGKER